MIKILIGDKDFHHTAQIAKFLYFFIITTWKLGRVYVVSSYTKNNESGAGLFFSMLCPVMKPGRTRNEIPNKEIYCFEIFFTLNDLILIGSVNIVLIITLSTYFVIISVIK
mgnify:CR=1 FL=1